MKQLQVKEKFVPKHEFEIFENKTLLGGAFKESGQWVFATHSGEKITPVVMDRKLFREATSIKFRNESDEVEIVSDSLMPLWMRAIGLGLTDQYATCHFNYNNDCFYKPRRIISKHEYFNKNGVKVFIKHWGKIDVDESLPDLVVYSLFLLEVALPSEGNSA